MSKVTVDKIHPTRSPDHCVISGVREGGGIPDVRRLDFEKGEWAGGAVAKCDQHKAHDEQDWAGCPPQPQNRLIQVQRIAEIGDQELAPPQQTREAQRQQQDASGDALTTPHEVERE